MENVWPIIRSTLYVKFLKTVFVLVVHLELFSTVREDVKRLMICAQHGIQMDVVLPATGDISLGTEVVCPQKNDI